MTRQEKRRKERESEFKKELQNERYLINYPVKLFDEDTGQSIDFLVGYCPFCKNRGPTVYSLAEWSHEQRRLIFKVTGRDELDGGDTFDFYCHACGVHVANSKVMKDYVELAKRENEKMRKFPDEYFGSLVVPDIKRNHLEIMEQIRMLKDSPDRIKDLNAIRYSKTYKAYPASLSDEDRLLMTFFSWNVRFNHIADALPEDEAYREWEKLMNAEGVPDID
jgi:hypothetical protein